VGSGDPCADSRDQDGRPVKLTVEAEGPAQPGTEHGPPGTSAYRKYGSSGAGGFGFPIDLR